MASIYLDSDDQEETLQKLADILLDKQLVDDEEHAKEKAQEILDELLPEMGIGLLEKEE